MKASTVIWAGIDLVCFVVQSSCSPWSGFPAQCNKPIDAAHTEHLKNGHMGDFNMKLYLNVNFQIGRIPLLSHFYTEPYESKPVYIEEAFMWLKKTVFRAAENCYNF